MQIRVEGAEGLRVDADGTLCIDTELGPIRQPRAKTWEVDGRGERRPREIQTPAPSTSHSQISTMKTESP